MAKMQLNAFANAMSGKLGNAVFADTKEGTEVRPYVIPNNPNTAAQRVVRNNFTKYTAGWSLLTAAQKAPWLTYARNIYGGLTTKFFLINPTGTAPITPPVTTFAGDSITVTVAIADSTLTFIASAANAAGVRTELLLQKLLSDDRTPQKDAYRTKQYASARRCAIIHPSSPQ